LANRRAVGRGFTLIELLVVLALVAVAVGMATVMLRDGNESLLEEESQRLAALLEGARANARVSGQTITWAPVPTDPAASQPRPGFRFSGLPPRANLPSHWLAPGMQAEVLGAPVLRLGPEPIIGPQALRLKLGERELILATDGLGPFVRHTGATWP
jgi:general secretion pathway protein H